MVPIKFQEAKLIPHDGDFSFIVKYDGQIINGDTLITIRYTYLDKLQESYQARHYEDTPSDLKTVKGEVIPEAKYKVSWVSSVSGQSRHVEGDYMSCAVVHESLVCNDDIMKCCFERMG
jgi:hypothetical protein